MNRKICLVRSPYLYKYNNLLADEDAIITYLMGYFKSINFFNYYLFDFHLVRDTHYDDLLIDDVTDYVLSMRETGENVHYLRRLVKKLTQDTGKNIWIYGQIARLKKFKDWPKNVTLVHHSEKELAKHLGLSTDGKGFSDGLTCEPYFHELDISESMLNRVRANIETTRGCHFGCSFCFINQGKNYDSRWQLRPNKAILEDIRNYFNLGVTNFVFYDSEFIGKDESFYPQKIELLKGIRDEFPDIKFKIYARADTLLKLNQFKLLKDAGLVQVFVGVESLEQKDLIALNKGLFVEDVLKCIKTLKDYDIYSNLSFITFNRNTTIDTLETNFIKIEKLLEYKPHLIGIPAFTFAFETNWRKNKDNSTKKLSDKTYIAQDLKQKEQPEEAEIFNVELEALMEIYRLLSYEWNKKLIQINIARDIEDKENIKKINKWFHELSFFCLDIMKKHLNYLKEEKLSLDSLAFYREELFEDISNFYKILPKKYQALETYESHAKTMDYVDASEKVEEDEYWLDNIPV
jgi:radical SAM superfamily enzyme YgiQ (UPF0313 family)